MTLIDSEKIKKLRQFVENRLSWDIESPDRLQDDTQRCSPAIFILSPPRSGSTLLRVMLAGSPNLFAPPELELLSFTNLEHRHLALSVRHKSVLGGLVRAVMALKECTFDEAEQILKKYEQQATTTQAFYAQMQAWCGTRMLVDKSIHYSISPRILQRAERYFEGALYIHLTRHPYGTINSIEKLRLEQDLFGSVSHFTSRELAEYTWLISHENILSFLQEVPKSRQYLVRFEDLVQQPKHILEGLCNFLGLPFNAEMLEPHKEKYQRMTDTLTGSRIGDPNFHEHQTIDAHVAESWKKDFTPSPLSEHSLAIASKLSYWDVSYPRHLDRELLVQTNLAPNQLLIWLRLQYSPEASPIFYTVYRFNLPLAIQPAIFIQAFADVVQASDALCSIFSEVQGIPQRLVLPAIEKSIEFLDLSETEDNLSDWLTQRIEKLVDITQKCFDCVLIKLAAEQFVWYFKAHQIIIDDWSFNPLFHHVAARYHALLTDPSPAASLLIPSYQDYVAQQHHYLNSDKYQEDARFWAEYAVFHPLSWYGKQQVTSSTNTYLYTLKLPQATQDRLQNWHKAGDVSPQGQNVDMINLIATALAVYLRKITQSEDISIGTLQHNRLDQPATIGQFMRVLPFIPHIDDHEDLTSLYQRVKRQHRHILHHGQFVLPNPPPEPIYQVMINHVHHHFDDFCGVPVEVERLHSGHSAEILTLHLHDFSNAGQLRIDFEFNQEFFSPELCSLAVGHFQPALETMLEHPEQKVHQVSLITPQEVQQMQAWNDTAIGYPKDLCIHQLFEEQVEKTPNAIALVFEEQQLTYRQLNNKANQLAHYLLTKGVKPEVLVGICIERSLEMVIGLLGILKAGGAYLPLDMIYPTERLEFMLKDALVPVLLTQSSLKNGLPKTTAQVICLDVEAETLSELSTENLASQVAPENLAYVIYTSGSTGKPKGVQIQHQSLTNFLCSMAKEPGLTQADILLAVTTISFDIAGLELYLPLLKGAQILLVSREVAADGLQLLKKLNQGGITVMQATPATWRLLLAAGWKSSPDLRIFTGGEALSQELAHHLLKKSQAVWNVYGPTETTIWSSILQVGTQETVQTKGGLESIGHPIANTQIYLLDQYLQLVPIGVSGELHISGDGLARGYLNRPDLTADKFIPHPFSQYPNARLYKTGDLARYLPDGNIEYLNRIDNQVKLRGFRIELGEIEAVLAQHSEVHEAVVIIREDQPGDKRLVAYLVPKAQEVMPSNLRQFLQTKLPDYMVPSAFVKLETMPLTPNGKVDRRALPAPAQTWQETQEVPVAPQDDIENQLTDIWEELLGIRPSSIHDNFFYLGGHSLLVATLVDKIDKQFGKNISAMSVFQAPTIAQLSDILHENDSAVSWDTLQIQTQNAHTKEFSAPLFKGSAWLTSGIVTLGILAWLAIFEVGLSFVPYNPPTKQPNSAQRYLEYGRSVEGKIRQMIGPTDETTASVTLIGWLDAEVHERGRNIPTHPKTHDGLLIAIYGMSHAQHVGRALAKEPNITVRFWGGPGAPPNHSYKAYQLDRGRHTAPVVIIGVNAGSLFGMTTFTSLNKAFEHPLPYTYPKYRLVGEHLEEIWPSVRTMADFRRTLNDEILWKQYIEALKAEDSYYHPFLFDENFMDNFVISRFIRRSWSKKLTWQLKGISYNPASGFKTDSEVIQTLRLMLKEFARQARNDDKLPIVVLFNTYGYSNHLTQALAKSLQEADIPFVDSHTIAPSDDPKNLASDNFHFSKENDEKFAHEVLDIIHEHKVMP